ncbi:hypothetical protein SAMN04488694_15211 [Natrinema hispanicum]|uniref:Uncharacterized protein n=1 Tax=Natrinema hispanicum TaxID=392421 RepID=A0A1I0JNL4_9EURY|nr:hypothetical protein SAMN04488694_15211 [Natrinema hispanicum]
MTPEFGKRVLASERFDDVLLEARVVTFVGGLIVIVFDNDAETDKRLKALTYSLCLAVGAGCDLGYFAR